MPTKRLFATLVFSLIVALPPISTLGHISSTCAAGITVNSLADNPTNDAPCALCEAITAANIDAYQRVDTTNDFIKIVADTPSFKKVPVAPLGYGRSPITSIIPQPVNATQTLTTQNDFAHHLLECSPATFSIYHV